MKNIRTSARVLLAVALFGAALFPVSRARAEMPTVAVVNLQKILNESAAGKDVQAQLDKQRDAYRNEVASQEQQVKAMGEAFNTQKTKLSGKELAAKEQEIQTKINSLRELVRKRQDSLGKAANTAIVQIRKEIGAVVTEIALEKKYDIVLNTQEVVWAQSAMDITDTVRARLDKKVSKIKLNVEK